MHAICFLPAMIGKSRLFPNYIGIYQSLKKIINDVDQAVARTLFIMLEEHVEGERGAKIIHELREENLQVSLAAANELVDQEFAPSFCQLREAIRMDAGI